ncbi:DNA cytosine methyltransferase [Streptomyces spectabilis]|uniref:DNA (cytosine-5-)-methyltransferase n=1 Tax=Streptomyces spectabilis TaxID=68270 RepID=A0A5P2XAA3_STRST|nr:DNA (cytosine-5-)-methyltransferase [Streptomyces spectabilis]MCI3902949.1 DNA (cytosine-5-)-methyltransferase [Streptomyces spectabilis]QEV60219.1 DNA (cytosine-5-)-methyltransferase [Streptomyces spectabilis]GGV33292.1 cytosine-specific methyltransferase [Streptomyces spectabilis]
MSGLRFVDVCSGGGGLALGLEQAGFQPVLLLDEKQVACETLRTNRPAWNVLQTDLQDFNPVDHQQTYDVDLLSAGLPRVKSSATAKRVETGAELRLLEATVYLAHAVQPRALLIENVPGLVDSEAFDEVRSFIQGELEHLGYGFSWFILNAQDFGVPQDRKQGVLVALKKQYFGRFQPPTSTVTRYTTAGEALHPSMSARGWTGTDDWAKQADQVAPTLVGGSDKRGGADLGLTGSKRAWARMGINGGALADEVPGPDGEQESDNSGSSLKKLTVDQAAVLQAFPTDWIFAGKKTARYRQIGHASPPPVGKALGTSIADALQG